MLKETKYKQKWIAKWRSQYCGGHTTRTNCIILKLLWSWFFLLLFAMFGCTWGSLTLYMFSFDWAEIHSNILDMWRFFLLLVVRKKITIKTRASIFRASVRLCNQQLNIHGWTTISTILTWILIIIAILSSTSICDIPFFFCRLVNIFCEVELFWEREKRNILSHLIVKLCCLCSKIN